MGKPVSIKDALGKTLRGLGLERRVRETGAAQVWAEVVGEKISQVTEVTAVRDGIMFVSVKSATWRQELSLMKIEIIGRLNGRLGDKLITDIQFR